MWWWKAVGRSPTSGATQIGLGNAVPHPDVNRHRLKENDMLGHMRKTIVVGIKITVLVFVGSILVMGFAKLEGEGFFNNCEFTNEVEALKVAEQEFEYIRKNRYKNTTDFEFEILRILDRETRRTAFVRVRSLSDASIDMEYVVDTECLSYLN